VYGLLGPNGSGKSTTLAMILGVTRPTAGQYQWFDGAYSGARSRRRIGSILERPNFYSYLSVVQNLKVTCAIRGLGTSADIDSVLKLVGLDDAKNQPFDNLSLGMQQRLAMAAALVGETDVLVLDEPTNGVDAKGIAEIRQIILDVASQGKTIILASHILDEVQKVCTHISILKAGRVLESGSIENLLSAEECIEIAGHDMQGLFLAMENLKQFESIERHEEYYVARLRPGADIAQINAHLVHQGHPPFHLSRIKQSLEARFLEITGEQ